MAFEYRLRRLFSWDRRRFYFGRSQIVEAIPRIFASIAERLTGGYRSVCIDSKTIAGVAAAMGQLKEQYVDQFPQVFRSIATDNGNEFTAFSAVETLGTQIYFAHSSQWNRL